QMNVGFDRLHEFGFEQQLGEAQSLYGIPLHHLDHGRRKVGADIAEPARHPWCRSTEAGGSVTARPAAPAIRVVYGAQRLVDGRIVCSGELAERGIGRAAEDEAPPAQPLLVRDRVWCGAVHAGTPRISATARNTSA